MLSLSYDSHVDEMAAGAGHAAGQAQEDRQGGDVPLSRLKA